MNFRAVRYVNRQNNTVRMRIELRLINIIQILFNSFNINQLVNERCSFITEKLERSLALATLTAWGSHNHILI